MRYYYAFMYMFLCNFWQRGWPLPFKALFRLTSNLYLAQADGQALEMSTFGYGMLQYTTIIDILGFKMCIRICCVFWVFRYMYDMYDAWCEQVEKAEEF